MVSAEYLGVVGSGIVLSSGRADPDVGYRSFTVHKLSPRTLGFSGHHVCFLTMQQIHNYLGQEPGDANTFFRSKLLYRKTLPG